MLANAQNCWRGVMNKFNEIPELIGPYLKYWKQPDDIRSAPMDDTYVLLTKEQIEKCSNYSKAGPLAKQNGQCWLKKSDGVDFLCWYWTDHFTGLKGHVGIRIVLTV